MKLLDISDIANPTVLATCSLDNIANSLQFKDPYVYVANGPYLTILYHTPTGVEENKGFKGSRVQGFKTTPNPFTSFATVPGHSSDRFALYDISGRRVETYKGDRIGEGLAPSVYFIKLDGKDQTLVRVVKLR